MDTLNDYNTNNADDLWVPDAVRRCEVETRLVGKTWKYPLNTTYASACEEYEDNN